MIHKKFIGMIPYKPEHLDELIPSLRSRDVSNIVAQGGIGGLREALEWMNEFAIMLTFLTYEKKVAAIFAIVRDENDSAVIWAVTGTEVDRLPKAFVHACKRLLPKINSCLDTPLKKLKAFVHSDYDRSVSWVERLGFIKDISETKEVNGEEYFCFARDMGGLT